MAGAGLADWRYDLALLVSPLAHVSQRQGLLFAMLADIGLGLRDQASLAASTDDVLKTSEIEGEHVNVSSVRASIARRLVVEIGSLVPMDRHVEGVVDMVLDATINSASPLTQERLFGWHAALFPNDYSGLSKISVGTWRDDAHGPMQVVSGPIGGNASTTKPRRRSAWLARWRDFSHGSMHRPWPSRAGPCRAGTSLIQSDNLPRSAMDWHTSFLDRLMATDSRSAADGHHVQNLPAGRFKSRRLSGTAPVDPEQNAISHMS